GAWRCARGGPPDGGGGRAAPAPPARPAGKGGTGNSGGRRTASPQRLAEGTPVDLAIAGQRQRRHAPHEAREGVVGKRFGQGGPHELGERASAGGQRRIVG